LPAGPGWTLAAAMPSRCTAMASQAPLFFALLKKRMRCGDND
jgi:hypothetical protein